MAEEAPAPPAQEKKKSSSEDEQKNITSMLVKVYSPFQVYYDEQAESISAVNDTGPFDVLPRHHNFITLLNACELDVRSSKTGNKRIKISRGVMHVRSNKVTVFLDV